jgi:Domain of unknown function (DUF4340)
VTPRQLGLIAAALAALLLLWGAAALIRNRGSSDAGGGFALGAIAEGGVDTVRLVRPEDTTTLVRRDSTTWTVNGHAAATDAVKELLDALADSARRSELVAERSASHAGLGVDTAGTLVTIAGGDTTVKLVVGQRSADLDGGYMRLAGDSAVWLVRGGLAGALGRQTDEWRDRRIGGAPPDSIARVEVGRGRRSYTLRRADRQWTVDGRAADSAAVRQLLEAFRTVEAGGFASEAQADSARFRPAERRARLVAADGAPLLTLQFDSMPGGFWVRADTGGVVYRMEAWTVDRLTPAESDLRAKP